jgi:hypothetical protein
MQALGVRHFLEKSATVVDTIFLNLFPDESIIGWTEFLELFQNLGLAR